MTEQPSRRDRYEAARKRHANAGIAHAKALDAYNRAAQERGEAEANLFRSMTLEELEAQVARTQGRYGPDRIHELAASLAEEASEVQEELCRQGGPGEENLLLELGDVLNVVTALAMHCGFTLEEVAEANDKKLRERWPDGLLELGRGEQ